MNKGKDLTEIRSPQRQLGPDTVGLEQGEQTFLRGIAIKAKSHQQHRFRDLYRCLNEALIHQAWKSLNKSAASGVDRVTAEAYAEDLHGNIQRLVERLKSKREPAPRSALGIPRQIGAACLHTQGKWKATSTRYPCLRRPVSSIGRHQGVNCNL